MPRNGHFPKTDRSSASNKKFALVQNLSFKYFTNNNPHLKIAFLQLIQLNVICVFHFLTKTIFNLLSRNLPRISRILNGCSLYLSKSCLDRISLQIDTDLKHFLNSKILIILHTSVYQLVKKSNKYLNLIHFINFAYCVAHAEKNTV